MEAGSWLTPRKVDHDPRRCMALRGEVTARPEAERQLPAIERPFHGGGMPTNINVNARPAVPSGRACPAQLSRLRIPSDLSHRHRRQFRYRRTPE